MGKDLVIVESPTKAKTITRILGKSYEIVSSLGHIIDLPATKLAVDVGRGFLPQYQVIPGKEKVLKSIKQKAKKAAAVYLATDPDREGEAISWHIKEQLKDSKKKFLRVVFHEITPEAIKEAFSSPGDIDMNKVNSQQARRVLDRIVGYSLSPLLWKKIARGLSAGRVQSVALKFIAEREKEIKSFIPQDFYEIEAVFKGENGTFKAKLAKYKGKKAVFKDEKKAKSVLEKLKKQDFAIAGILQSSLKKNPPPPFTTSLLQQAAFHKFHFSSQRTMIVAQHLYEGVELDSGPVGLITYMRTDSYQIANKAKGSIKSFIKDKFGPDYVNRFDYKYKTKKGAQLAHEAIRPTQIKREPQGIKDYLGKDHYRLYELIWLRTLACFMPPAVYELRKISISSVDSEFRVESRKLIFDGFLKLGGPEQEEEEIKVKNKEKLELKEIKLIKHTTKPPPRFSDASLVKLLEEKGIGRPSTYAPTIQTLILRNYVRRQKGYFEPTELGMQVYNLLSDYFSNIIDDNFTAQMEEKLDWVEEGKIKWVKILEDFYPDFKKQIDDAATKIKKHVEYTDKKCPRCGRPLVIKWSRKGKFLSCSGYPECKYAETITTGIKCPKCKKGELVQRRNKRGQIFYGCSRFPKCRYTTRSLPT